MSDIPCDKVYTYSGTTYRCDEPATHFYLLINTTPEARCTFHRLGSRMEVHLITEAEYVVHTVMDC